MIDKSIRDDFPFFSKEPNLVYFDNACMTLRPSKVIEAISKYYTDFPACSGRSNHRLAKRVNEEVLKAREKVQKFVGAKHSEEIVFTRNTTEGLNLLALSLGLKKGEVLVISGKEHNSNLVPWIRLKESIGIDVRVVVENDWEEAITEEVKVVSVVMTSNLDGMTNLINRISKLAHKVGAKLIVDGAQAVPHRKISVTELGVDAMCFSAHKMCGPSGMGAMYIEKGLADQLSPFLTGGDTVATTTYTSYQMLPIPEKFEAGLQDYAGIIGFGEAVDYLEQIGMKKIEEHELQLNEVLTEGLLRHDRVKLIGSKSAKERSGILSFQVDGADHHQISLMLDQMGAIAVRSGQHCVHSWFNHNKISGSVRASVYFYNTVAEAEHFLEVFDKIMRIV